jgi:hypothetical protein
MNGIIHRRGRTEVQDLDIKVAQANRLAEDHVKRGLDQGQRGAPATPPEKTDMNDIFRGLRRGGE